MIGQELVTLFGFKLDNSSLKTVNSAVKNLENGFGNLGKIVGVAGAALGALGGSFFVAKSAITYAASIEMLTTQFEVMTGSMTRAKSLMEEMRYMAAVTPFDTKSLADGARLMLAFGAEADDVMGNLYALGDITQGDKNRFNQINLAFSQMLAAGKLMGQDLLQMTTAGYNPLKTVAKQMEISYAEALDMMHRGKITPKMILEAMKADTGEGGKFFKGMEKGAMTLSGRFANMQDNLHAVGLAVTEKMLPRIKQLLNEFNIFIQGPLESFAKKMAPVFVDLVDLAKAFGRWVGYIFGDVFPNSVGIATNAVLSLKTILFNVMRVIAGVFWIVKPVLDAIVWTVNDIFDTINTEARKAAGLAGDSLYDLSIALRYIAVGVGEAIKMVAHLFYFLYEVFQVLSRIQRHLPLFGIAFSAIMGAMVLPKLMTAIKLMNTWRSSILVAMAAFRHGTPIMSMFFTGAQIGATKATLTMTGLNVEIGKTATVGALMSAALTPAVAVFLALAGAIAIATMGFMKWKSLSDEADSGEYGARVLKEDAAKKGEEWRKKVSQLESRLRLNDANKGSMLSDPEKAEIQKRLDEARAQVANYSKQEMQWQKQEQESKASGVAGVSEYGLPNMKKWMDGLKFNPEDIMAQIAKVKIPEINVNQQNDITLNAEVDKNGKTGLTPDELAKQMDRAMRSVWNIKLSKAVVQTMR